MSLINQDNRYLTGVSYPFYPVGVALIVISLVLFLGGFYLIVKKEEKELTSSFP